MPNAKVMAGASRLKQTIRTLRDHWLVTEATWSDTVRVRFEERYLAPLDPATEAAVIGLQKLAEKLDLVRRDCSDQASPSEHLDPSVRNHRAGFHPRPRLPPNPRSSREHQAPARSSTWFPARGRRGESGRVPRPRATPRPIPNSRKRHQGLTEKFAADDREARTADEQRRRGVIDAAMAGEAQAKAEFASASRKIAGEFKSGRERRRSSTCARQVPGRRHLRRRAKAIGQGACRRRQADRRDGPDRRGVPRASECSAEKYTEP